jgi:hypothetical protein
MNKRYKLALFVVCLIILLGFQSKLVMPWVYKIVASDLFLEDTGDDGSQTAITTDMTKIAFTQCNAYIKKDLESKGSIVFPQEALNSWKLGNYEYVINADIQVTPTNASPITKRYACDIKYNNKADKAGVSDINNWSINGVSGLDGL